MLCPMNPLPTDAGKTGSTPGAGAEGKGSGDEVSEREENESLPPTDLVCDEADDERVHGAAEHGRGQDDSDGDGSEIELGEIDAEDHSEETVGNRPDGLLEEDQFTVSIDPIPKTRRSTPLSGSASNTSDAAKARYHDGRSGPESISIPCGFRVRPLPWRTVA